MSFSKLFFIASVALFGVIAFLGITKRMSKSSDQEKRVQEIALQVTSPVAQPEPSQPPAVKKGSASVSKPSGQDPLAIKASEKKIENTSVDSLAVKGEALVSSPQELEEDLIDRTSLLFNAFGPHLPIVQTIRYTPRVNWVKDRPAWIVDYASHYQTSKHFISRSLTGKKEYFNNDISPGDHFNVLRSDISFEFFLLVDISRCKMRFYYVEPSKNEMVLLKTYKVVLGRSDPMSPSGCLTPLGRYKLGTKIAVYKPGMMGTFRKQKAEMIQIFGSRWIPFEEEVNGCSAPARGYGIHGEPWVRSSEGHYSSGNELAEKYASDGCIRLATDDVEELFSIIVTRPTQIEIVREFEHAGHGLRVVEPTIMMNP